MSNVMQYKGYTGSVEISEEDMMFYGKLLGIKGLIQYDGKTVEEFVNDFKNAIDDYIDMCSRNNIEPEKSYKGSFNVRISPSLHKNAAILAMSKDISLNRFVEEAISEKISNELETINIKPV